MAKAKSKQDEDKNLKKEIKQETKLDNNDEIQVQEQDVKDFFSINFKDFIKFLDNIEINGYNSTFFIDTYPYHNRIIFTSQVGIVQGIQFLMQYEKYLKEYILSSKIIEGVIKMDKKDIESIDFKIKFDYNNMSCVGNLTGLNFFIIKKVK